MRELAPGPDFKKGVDPARSAAIPQISLRVVTCLEVASVIISVLITIWAIVPFQLPQKWLASIPGLLALALIVNSHRVRGETPRDLGFTTQYMGRAVELLATPI